MEKRKGQRVVFNTNVELMTASGAVPVRCDSRNISTCGIYLQARDMLPIDTCCTLDIDLSSTTSNMKLHLQGRVCRHDRQGMGIAFVNVDPASFVHLKNFVALQKNMD